MAGNTGAVQASADILDQVDNVEVFDKLPDPELGSYVGELLAAKQWSVKPKTGGPTRQYFGYEWLVKEASPGSSFRPGDKFKHTIPLTTDYPESAFKKLKLSASKICDKPLEAVTGSYLREIADENEQPAKGMLARIQVDPPTKAGSKFNNVSYRTYRAGASD